MKSINIQYVMLLTCFVINSSSFMHADSPKKTSEKNNDEKVSFLDKMHEIQSELRDIKKSEKDYDKATSLAMLHDISIEIDALENEDKHVNSHNIHMRTLRRQLRSTHRSIEKNGLKTLTNAKIQSLPIPRNSKEPDA